MASMDTRAIEDEIDHIRSLGLEELRREWRRLNHGEPPRISRDLGVLLPILRENQTGQPCVKTGDRQA
jgi:hypothetical protein